MPEGCFTNISRALQNKNNENTQCQKSHLWWEFQAETLYVCPKLGFGHTYKVHLEILIRNMISAIHKFQGNVLESLRNVSETITWSSVCVCLICMSVCVCRGWRICIRHVMLKKATLQYFCNYLLYLYSRRDQFIAWAEALADNQTPSWLGLPNNAERVLLTTHGKGLLAINSLTHGRGGSNFENEFQHIVMIDILRIFRETDIRWIG